MKNSSHISHCLYIYERTRRLGIFLLRNYANFSFAEGIGITTFFYVICQKKKKCQFGLTTFKRQKKTVIHTNIIKFQRNWCFPEAHDHMSI